MGVDGGARGAAGVEDPESLLGKELMDETSSEESPSLALPLPLPPTLFVLLAT